MADAEQVVIRLAGVRVGYGGVEALHGVSLYALRGETVAIIGANGAGKTTTLNAICGRFKLDAGQVTYKDIDISSLETQKIVELGVAHVPEGRRVFPGLSVRENLIAGRHRQRKGATTESALLERVLQRFPKLRLRFNQRAWSLSGGEQQMLALGRALMGEPELLLLDEPSLGLAPILKSEVFGMIDELHKEGMTIILVEQDAGAALAVADRAYVMELGAITLEGSGSELSSNDQVRAAYLGG